jgi:alkylated DNA repair dioxygenase AlkB
MQRCWACCSDVDCDARRDEHLQLHAGPSSNEPLYVLVAEEFLALRYVALAGFALDAEEELLSSLKDVIERSPFRNMVTPGGFRMSVAMSNCGSLGWIRDRTGYRYDEINPEANRPWPTNAHGISRARSNCRRRGRLPELRPGCVPHQSQ